MEKDRKNLTGFSKPIFGISWTPPETDRDVVRRLRRFLEDRRALYNPYNIETPLWVINSVLEIRKRLTDTLETLDEDSDIVPHLRAMRAACRNFLDKSEALEGGHFPVHFEMLFTALGEMRAVIGIQVARLCVKYGIDIEADLASILPIADTGEKNEEC